MPSRPNRTLETFDNPNPERDFVIHMEIPEFTCLCPKTGQPDFATLHLAYVPDRKCVELKSLKLYIWSYRDEGVFHEAVTNRILDDLAAAAKPRFMRLTARFYVRGGSLLPGSTSGNFVPPRRRAANRSAESKIWSSISTPTPAGNRT